MIAPCGRRLLVTGAATALALSGLSPAPAWAAGAERTGWWTALSAGGAVLPAATTMPGDLRVASGGNGPTAYAAVLVTAPGSTSATLDLLLRAGSAVGTAEVVACPTATADWPAGDNQPIADGPAYDCTAGSAFGSLSEDGTTLSFALDTSTQTAPGTWSLAVLPSPDSTAPFALDLQPPGPQAFTAAPPDATAPDPEPAAGDPAGGATDPGTGEVVAPPLTGFDTSVPPLLELPSDVAAAPLLAGAADPAVPAPAAAAPVGPAPAVAAAPARRRTLAVRPVAQQLPGEQRERLLALLLLVGLSGAVGYAAGQQRPGPRLIGGRASSAPSTVAAPAPAPDPVARERGIGRFAKARDTPPRRLR